MATRVGTPQHDEAIADETAALRRADDARSMRVFHATVGLPVVLGAGAIAAAPGAAAAASTGLGGALLTNGTIAVVGLSQTSTQPTAALVYGPPAQGVRCVTRTGSQADVVGACISTGTAVVTLGIGAGAGASARLGAMTDALASESAAAGSQGLVEGVGELGGLRPTIPAGSPAMCVETASGSIALIAAGDQPASTGFTVSVPATKSGGMEEFVTLYHGTSSNRAAKIVGSEYYDAQGFRPSPKDDAVFFAEDYDTAEHFAFQSEYPRGGTPPQSFTVMELKIPKSLAQRVGLLKSTPIGEFREAPFIQPGTSPYERVLVGDDVGDFNQALLNGDIKVRRLKVGGQ